MNIKFLSPITWLAFCKNKLVKADNFSPMPAKTNSLTFGFPKTEQGMNKTFRVSGTYSHPYAIIYGQNYTVLAMLLLLGPMFYCWVKFPDQMLIGAFVGWCCFPFAMLAGWYSGHWRPEKTDQSFVILFNEKWMLVNGFPYHFKKKPEFRVIDHRLGKVEQINADNHYRKNPNGDSYPILFRISKTILFNWDGMQIRLFSVIDEDVAYDIANRLQQIADYLYPDVVTLADPFFDNEEE